jgi:hypothetical protein
MAKRTDLVAIAEWFERHQHDEDPPLIWREYFAEMLAILQLLQRDALEAEAKTVRTRV